MDPLQLGTLNTESFDPYSVPSLDAALLDTDWTAAFHELVRMPLLNNPIQSHVSACMVSRQPTGPPQHLMANQTSPSITLYCPENADSFLHLDPLTHVPIFRSPLDLTSDLHLSQNENLDDLEGVGKILCRAPVGLDRMVDSNSLMFVLCAYSQWIPLVVFDPLQIIHTSQETIKNQFLESPASRCRLLLISELMRKLVRSRGLDEGGDRMLTFLGGEVQRNITEYRAEQRLLGEEERRHATGALDHIVELLSIYAVSAPLALTLRLLQLAAPVFLRACSPHHPPHMSVVLLNPSVNLRHFVVADVVTSITTGRSLLCRYHVPWSLDLCKRFTKTGEDQGLQWKFGIPDQFILLFGYMDGLKENATATATPVDPRVIEQIEEDISRIIIPPCKGRDASLAIGRMVVQECWRKAVFIYMYMALCGVHALDPRVVNAQKGFMKLVNGIKPGRNPDAFLVLPMMIAGVATTKFTHQQTIASRILTIPQFINSNTSGNDSLCMLRDIWVRIKAEDRAARWEDLREACRRVTGI
ncbi:hypothetical protein RSOLAG1IB_06227 [Rhizoctonia solani AG-1 IB]|uniref:Fungal zn(2)-Cys(6) binuclear cluster domain-containing protein n=1 Tax=Thanatephorus cucumeris (strain AG1-IB / isolate 7/3/14) TaxID=1108050 RepID=A0A0B7F6U1_THACB|nr:hypothetical protein RSOLAG1IB_06227 [Rhizoctonia solani AG-1 IB]